MRQDRDCAATPRCVVTRRTRHTFLSTIPVTFPCGWAAKESAAIRLDDGKNGALVGLATRQDKENEERRKERYSAQLLLGCADKQAQIRG